MIAVLDACVLYPPSLRDLLLTLASLDAFEARWSDEILDEVERNVVADHPDVSERFRLHTIGAMQRSFPEASVPTHPDLVATLDNDPKDRHVAATAVAAGALAIVTLNVSDFESQILRDAGVEIVTPGALVEGLLVDDAGEVLVMAVDRMSERWVNPPRTPLEILDLLAAHPTMASPMASLRSRFPSG